jgi:hypothetical protein
MRREELKQRQSVMWGSAPYERLELPDASFDVVSSTCGVMFALDHEATARVTRPGGRIALANWTPTGGVARMFGMIAPFQPATPPRNPSDWGDVQRVQALLGEHFGPATRTAQLDLPDAEWRGLLGAVLDQLRPDQDARRSLGERREQLRRAWIEFFDTNHYADGEIAHTREYLLVVGVRR